MVIVVHQSLKSEHAFALPDYTQLITKDLDALGSGKDEFQTIEVPANHPVTLTQAQVVPVNVCLSGLRSAILMAKGFHARRGYWAHKQAATRLGIKIIPHPYFTDYKAKHVVAWD